MPISQIVTNSIANEAVVEADLANGAVTSAKLAAAQTLSVNGITFPATQVPSASANTLDDYEEGTFTPSYTSAGISAITYGSGRNGYYTKVGRLVTITINIMTDSITVTNGSSVVTVSGLPFTASGATESNNAIAVGTSARWTSNPPNGGVVGSNSTSITIYRNYFTTAADSTQNTVSDMPTGGGNNNILRLTATYFTA
jgi:hypothetical protein